MRNKLLPGLLLSLLFLLNTALLAQQPSNVASYEVKGGVENEPLPVELTLMQGANVNRVMIAYKTLGTSEFRVREMYLSGPKATITIPASEVLPPSIEYYFIIENANGQKETYPIGAPQSAGPLLAQVRTVTIDDEEVAFLSPAQDDQLTIDEFFISVSLLRVARPVNAQATKLYIDGEQLTGISVVSEDLVIYRNDDKKLAPGVHFITAEVYDSAGSLYKKVFRRFRIVDHETAAASAQSFQNQMSFQGESRNEKVKGISTWYNIAMLNSQTEYGDWALSTNFLITSEEKKYLQPNNRYSVTLESSWLKLSAGDSYPDFPSLILSGKRVRGISGGLDVGFFGIQASYGEITRPVEGRLLSTYSAGEAVNNSGVIDIDSLKYGNPKGLVDLGTYKRNLLAVRPYFAAGETFQLGFSYLHAIDKKESIEFGTRPKENVVVGSDLRLAFDSQRIVFETQAALSIQNNDIAEGTLTDEKIDSVFAAGNEYDLSAQDVKDMKNLLGNIITVNQHIAPMNPEKLPTLAAESGISLNYFDNYLKAGYIYRGNDFQSFGQSYLRTDVAGFSFTDRLRLLQNRLFLAVSYENLYDNLQNTKPARTNYRTISSSVSFFPRGGYPNVIAGYSVYKNDNGLAASDSLAVLDLTNRLTLQFSYDFSLKVQHRSALTFSNSARNDDSYRNLDVKNNSLMFSLNSYWTRLLSTSFSFSANSSQIAATKFSYSGLSAGSNYELIDDRLMISGLLNFNFGDLRRQAFDISGEYTVISRLKLHLLLRYLNYSGSSDRIVSFITSYEL